MTAWFTDPSRAAPIVLPDGILADPRRSGSYADLPPAEDDAVLEILARPTWHDDLRTHLNARSRWLADIVTDPRRSAVLPHLRLRAGRRILDVGSGWGQLSVPLAGQGHAVVSLDQTVSRLRLLAAIARNMSVSCHLACGDIETYPLRPAAFDLIILNGVLEWTVRDRAPGESTLDRQAAVLRRCRDLLAPGGEILLAIENSIGLKYLMGSRDDHSCLPFWSFLGDEEAERRCRQAGGNGLRARTRTLRGYVSLAQRCGLAARQTWGCFPDYKLPEHVIDIGGIDGFLLSDARWVEHHGDNGEPIADQVALRDAYRACAEQGIGAAVAPSYALSLVAIP